MFVSPGIFGFLSPESTQAWRKADAFRLKMTQA